MKYATIIGTLALSFAAAHAETPANPTERLSGSGIYTQTPTGPDFARYYPPRALAEKKDGRVTLDCIVQADQSLKCAVRTEDPTEYGFGPATLSLANAFRVAAIHDGAPTVGKSVVLPVWWRME